MRLIDADAVLQYLREKLSMFDSVDGKMGLVPTTIRNDLQGFVEDILEQPTIPAPRWVRCEDEMPTKAGRYLVMDKDGDFNVDEWHNTFGWRFITQFDADRITHWMPIEPPKEGE